MKELLVKYLYHFIDSFHCSHYYSDYFEIHAHLYNQLLNKFHFYFINDNYELAFNLVPHFRRISLNEITYSFNFLSNNLIQGYLRYDKAQLIPKNCACYSFLFINPYSNMKSFNPNYFHKLNVEIIIIFNLKIQVFLLFSL